MEIEKRGVKGGLFQLFDWNGKSRKKLFPSKSEFPENSNRGRENYHGSVMERRQQGLEKGFPSNANHNNYHYASSASGDSEYGIKAPGVVARLMGLDSLPTSNVNEPCFTPFVESHSFRDSSYLMAAPALQSEHDIVIFESVRNKLDGLSRNPLDLRLQKVQSRPLERFQTEVLPPKSAKPISITHHRLLSPIKSPGFVPPKNAAYIIEAAAKIIEQSPRATSKTNFPSLGSSSVPFRIQDLKEKMEAAQRSSRSANESPKAKEQNLKSMKRQLNARGQVRQVDNYLHKGSEESRKVGSQRLVSKEKSVSLAVQAKTNIQKKDGVTAIGNSSFEKQKQHNDVKSSSLSRNLPNTQKKVEKQSSSKKSSEVLKLNNQKQNCVSAEECENLKPSCSHTKEKRQTNLSTNHINRRPKRTVNKIVINNVVTSKKTNFVAADPDKELSSSREKTTSKKKQPMNGDIQSSGSVSQKAVMLKNEKSVKCNVTFKDDSKWDEIDKKNSLDVVSFTFTSPIKKSGAGLNLRGSNVGGDALSVLLEQKLKELTSKVELSQKDMSERDSVTSSANNHGNKDSTVNLVKSLPLDSDIRKSKQEIQNASDSSSADELWLKAEKENKGLEYMETNSDNNNMEYRKCLHLKGSISASSQPSLSGASSNSFDVDRNSSYEGYMPCFSLESSEGMNWSSTRKFHMAEGDLEISDTASSQSIGTMSETVTSSLYMTDSKDSSRWELQYIGDILSNAELLLEEFALGQSHKVMPPDLFDHLENTKLDSYKVMDEHVVLERKVLFDSVGECLEVRCGRLLAGSCKFWAKQMMMLHKRKWLADDLYREILSWANDEELMVDELVDKDMSSKNGKWIDFEVEAFEEGVEIERRILTSLVDELIDDFLS